MAVEAAFLAYRHHRYRPLSAMATHVHARPSMTLVTGGRYEDTIRGRSVSHPAGSLVFCPPNEPHCQRFGPQGASKLVLSPAPWTLDLLAEHTPLPQAPFLHDAEAILISQRLLLEMDHADPFSGLAVDALLHQLVALFGRGHARQAMAPHCVRAASEFLAVHACEPLRIGQVAEAAGVSSLVLATAFKRHVGRSMSAHQRRLRVTKAAEMLTSSKDSIAEVAIACGYCDQAHFTRAFKVETGRTPARYRAGR